MGKRRTPRDILKTWLPLSILIGLLLAIVLPGLLQGGYRPSGEPRPTTMLKIFANAQQEFRLKDCDGNGKKDYWRADITGLYVVKPKNNPELPAIKLITLRLACADDRPVTDLSPYGVRTLQSGYWYRALLHEDESAPNPDRFAACAFPDSPAAGKWTYIVDENRVIYRKALGTQRGLEVYPKDPVKAGWEEED